MVSEGSCIVWHGTDSWLEEQHKDELPLALHAGGPTRRDVSLFCCSGVLRKDCCRRCCYCACCLVCVQLLHARCTDLKSELRTLMLQHGIKSMRLVPVKRSYAFEDPNIPAREQWVIKVGYPGLLCNPGIFHIHATAHMRNIKCMYRF